MASPTFETILYDVEDGVATITMNRPDRMNAFTPRMMLDMIAAFDATDADDAVKAVIVTGAGDRAFCAGADLKAIAVGGGNPVEREGDFGPMGPTRLMLSKPVIAAVEGSCAGAGFSLALACDFVVAAHNAVFVMAYSNVGLSPDVAPPGAWCAPCRAPPPCSCSWQASASPPNGCSNWA